VLTLTRWPVKAGDRPPAVSTIVIRCPDGTEVRVRLVNIRCLTRAVPFRVAAMPAELRRRRDEC